MKRSSQGLIPFIRLNGYQVEDSSKCIEYLSEIFQKDLNAELSDEQKAIGRAVVKLCDESLRWFVYLNIETIKALMLEKNFWVQALKLNIF